MRRATSPTFSGVTAPRTLELVDDVVEPLLADGDLAGGTTARRDCEREHAR